MSSANLLNRVCIYLLITLYLIFHINGQNVYSKLPSNKLIRHRRHKMLQIEDISYNMLIELDTSCISHGFIKAPNIENGKVVRYSQKTVPFKDKTKENGKEKKFLVATYSCSSGYNFEIDGPVKMYCSKKKWIGTQPVCHSIKLRPVLDLGEGPERISLAFDRCPTEFSKGCEHDCVIEHGQPTCICHEGFSMVDNKCLDINECKVIENIKEICKFGCINTHGSYYCLKQMTYREPNFANPKRATDRNTDKNLEGSGSGDYDDEEYSESNSENEDDEDYVDKKRVDHTDRKPDPKEFATTTSTPVILKTSIQTTLLKEDKIDFTTDKTADDIHFAKQPNKEDSDYYYEEYDYKEGDKNSENSVISKENNHTPDDVAENKNSIDEDFVTLLTTQGFSTPIKPHDGVTVQHETSISPISFPNLQFDEITPIVVPTEPSYNNSTTDTKTPEEEVFTTLQPIYTSPDNQQHNQSHFNNGQSESNSYPTDGSTIVDRTAAPDDNNDTEPSQNKIFHSTTEQRKEVTTVYEEENFGVNYEKFTPQVIDDYDYVTTTLRTPILKPEPTTIFDLSTNNSATERSTTALPTSTISKQTTTQNQYDYDYTEQDYKEEIDNNSKDVFKPEYPKESVLSNTTESNNINKEVNYNEKEENLKSETTPNASTTSASINFQQPAILKSDKSSDNNENLGKEDDIFKVTTEYSSSVNSNPSVNNNQTQTPLNVNENSKNEYENYNEKDYKEEYDEETEEDYYLKPQITHTTNSTPVNTSPSPPVINNQTDSHRGEKKYSENDYEEYGDYKETNSKPEINKNREGKGVHKENSETGNRSLECTQGFKLDENFNCIDINECTEKGSICSHVCENTIGSYRCLCPLGSIISHTDPHICEEFDQCLNHPCSHICINQIDSFTCDCPSNHYLFNHTTCLEINCSHDHIKASNGIQCLCPTGFHLHDDGYTCEDFDECENEQNNNCSHFCENTYGSYKCFCKEGYRLIDDGYGCQKSNHCETHSCDHNCNNNLDSYTCSCRNGYYLMEDEHSCVDLNECEGFNNCSQVCFNNEGGYKCDCFDGFKLTEDGVNCKDENECLFSNGGCSHLCVNTNGSHYCECPKDFILGDTKNCVLENPCIVENGGCSDICTNVNSQVVCSCPENYELRDNTCFLINGCEKNNGGCTHLCVNTNGSHYCECPEGFILTDKTTCVLENPCSVENGGCSDICTNVNGQPTCSCPEHFEIKDNTCFLTNSCKINNGGCTHLCINTNGSHYCECPEGFILTDKTTCVLENPCNVENGGCSDICTNVNGQPTCSCPEHFEIKDNTCFLTNSCKISNGGCTHLCVNTDGSHYCECPKGFILSDKTTCVLENPCSVENGGCSDICTNVNGQPTCSCPEHFELKENTCYLINACEVDNGGCSHVCEITGGKVECSCPSAHVLVDGQICKEIDLCADNNGGCSHECAVFERKVVCKCPQGYNLMKSKCVKMNLCELNNGNCSHTCNFVNNQVECSCPENYKLVNDINCVNHESCAHNNGGCSHTCVENAGRISCSCPKHYKLADGKMCVESDPCLINNGGCSHECLYNDKKINCLCPSGYNLIGKSCYPVDPCYFQNGGCSHTCVNINGEAFCKCPSGFKLFNRHCFKINPCSINNGGCAHHCTNVDGRAKCSCATGYVFENNACLKQNLCSINNGGCSHFCTSEGTAKCSCPAGFILRPNKKLCKEINECRINNGGCSHGCRNLPGSHECTCQSGYHLDHTNRTCVDVDECANNNGGCQQTCKNYPGGFRCNCQEGYLLQNDHRTCTPKSVAECLIPRAPKNGKIRCLQTNPNSTYASVGTQCVAWCHYGYKLRGHSLTTCNSLGNWDASVSHCEPVSCPKLDNVANGYFTPSLCMTRNLFAGENCDLRCNPGYKPSRDLKTLTCLSNFQWSPNVDEISLSRACTRESTVPFIKCPNNGFLSFTLPKGRNTMLVTIPQPETNVDWWQYVSSKPSWGMRLQNYISPERTDVIFSARTPATNSTVSCRLIINVVDKEAPEMYNCPTNIEHKAESREYSQVVHWSEPTFRDNVEVVGIYKSREPGTRFRIGSHHIYYVARDEAGNQARCQFTVTVKGSDVRENRSTPYRAILICPHGIQYMDKSPEEYDNEALKRQGCHWNTVRSRRPVNHHSYMVKPKGGQEDQPSRFAGKEYHPLSLYNQCC